MYLRIANELDKIAESLEGKGLLKEATQLDIVTNTIEKLSYNQDRDALFTGQWKNLMSQIDRNISAFKMGSQVNLANSINILDTAIEKRFKPFVKNYGKFVPGKKLEKLLEDAESAKAMLGNAEKNPDILPKAKEALVDIVMFWGSLDSDITQAEQLSRTQN